MRTPFSSEALSLAEESAGIGVWDIDLGTGTARGTEQFFRIMGLPPTAEPFPMASVRALRHPEDQDRVLQGFRDAVDSGSDLYEIEYRIVRPDGEVRWIFGRGRVVRDATGQPVRYSGVDIDITQRKAAEIALAQARQDLERLNAQLEQRVHERTAQLEAEAARRAQAEARLHQSQKMEALGQLTGGIAHDFNNLLQVIMGNLEVMRRLIPRVDPQPPRVATALQPSIDNALKATRNAAQLTKRLLAFSRQQALEPAPLAVDRLIGDMAEMIRRTLGETVAVETALAARTWPVMADRNQLESALLNLVVNARDAMADGGRVMIRTENVEHKGDDELPAGRYAVVTVADSGCGIAPDILPRVFDPFFTTKDTGKGSGLGLSMVYGFVKQSGGHVRIQSEPGQGTTVRLYLPPTDVPPAPPPAASPADAGLPHARDGETILVVEDNDSVRRYCVGALESIGYRVLQARDALDALEVLDGDGAAGFHLLFTDIVLPGGMTGRKLAEVVRERRGPALPVLFTSGYAGTAMAPGDAGADVRLLHKPYSLENLAVSVRRALDADGWPPSG